MTKLHPSYMTKARAFEVLHAMDRESRERFTPEQREALMVLGAAYLMGDLTPAEKAELDGIAGRGAQS